MLARIGNSVRALFKVRAKISTQSVRKSSSNIKNYDDIWKLRQQFQLQVRKNGNSQFSNTRVTKYRWFYRQPTPHVIPGVNFKAEAIMAVMWYWILFHCWYQPDTFTGHNPYPDPSKWTDKELGIPDEVDD